MRSRSRSIAGLSGLGGELGMFSQMLRGSFGFESVRMRGGVRGMCCGRSRSARVAT